MSKYTTGQLIKDATRKLSGAATSQSTDFFGAVDEARRLMIGKIRPVEMVRDAYIEQAVFDQVDQYAVAEDLNYDNLIEVKLLSGYRNVDTLSHPLKVVYNRRFDQKRRSAKNVCAITWVNGVKYIRIFNPTGLQKHTQTQINTANSLEKNGTWNVGGNVVNLSLDRLRHISGFGAIRFDINNSANSGFIENLTMNAVDITDYLQVGAVFVWLDIENPKDLLSVQLTIESSPGNSYQYSVNQSHDNTSFIAGWNLLKFTLDPNNGLVINGTPNPTQITGMRLDFSTTGTQPVYGCHIDNVVLRRGVVYKVLYETSYCFRDARTGAWKQYSDSNSDIITLEEDAYQILMLFTAITLMNDLGKKNQTADMKDDLNVLIKNYRMAHKSEQIPRQSSTYIHGNMYDGYMDDPMTNINEGNTGSQSENESPENYDDSYGSY